MSKLFVVAICAFVAAVSVVAMPNIPGCGPPPNQKNPMECCDIPMMIEKATSDACAAKHGAPNQPPQGPPPAGAGGPPPKAPSGPHPGACMMECKFNSTKTVINGNIDMAAMKAFIKGRVSGDWTAVLEKAVEECVAEAKQESGPPMPADSCDHKYGHILMCSQHKAFANCPASAYKASAECDELKKFSQKCPLPMKM